MSRANSHNFSLGFKSKISPDQLAPLYIFYRYGSVQKKRSAEINITGKEWDQKSQHLHKSVKYNTEYSKDVEFIDKLKRKFNEVTIELNSGLMTIETAFSKLLDKNPDGEVRKWLEESNCYSPKTQEKYMNQIMGIEKNTSYKPLKFVHLQDTRSIQDIASQLKASTRLNSNSIRDYMMVMDSVTENVPLKLKEPFKNQKLKPSYQDPDILPRTPMDIFKAIQRIPHKVVNKDNKEWYLALNLWLYSFSLRGLTGKDIPNICEKYVIGEKYKLPYFPDHMAHDEYKSLGGKSYLHMRRGKKANQKKMTILLNSVPSFLLHQSLKQLIKECLPQYAYQGKDKLRLFNFITKNEKYEPDAEGEKKWKDLYDWSYKRLKRMLGVGLHNTRHTYTSLANSFLNLTDSEQREQIGQKTKGALKHYQTPNQIRADINHMSILDDFNFLHIVKIFFALGYTQEYLSHVLTQGAVNLIKEDRLQSFNSQDMFELESLRTQWKNKPETIFNEDGELIIQESEKPQKLIEMEKQMKKFESKPSEDWREEATKDIFGFMSKRDKFYIEEGYATEMSIKLMQEYEDKQIEFDKKK